MTRNKGVSIIIPCYNDGRFLMEALRSVYAQDTKLSFEVIIVDDGSEDETTLQAFDEAEKKFPDVRIIRNDHQGVSAARNTGLSLARYDYIFALDVDNKLSTDPALVSNGRSYMDRCVNILENDPDVLMVCCRAKLFGANTTDQWPVPQYSGSKALLLRNSLDAHSMYRKEEALACGGYSETIPNLEDWDFAIAMHNHRFKNGRPVKVETIDEPVFMYRVRGDGTNRWASAREKIDETFSQLLERNKELYRKYHPHVKTAAQLHKARKHLKPIVL